MYSGDLYTVLHAGEMGTSWIEHSLQFLFIFITSTNYIKYCFYNILIDTYHICTHIHSPFCSFALADGQLS